MNIQAEFQKQVQTLLKKSYPHEAGLSEQQFLEHINPLFDQLKDLSLSENDFEQGQLAFIIVIKSELVQTKTQMSLVTKNDKAGITKLYPHEPEDFTVIPSITIPQKSAYLLIDIDRGKETINIPPKEALNIIQNENRSPLTIDEGIAIITHYPEFLMKNNCFSLLASRNPSDKRVPAIWINSQQHPNLGWCWEGNPHTWLGSASCRTRL